MFRRQVPPSSAPATPPARQPAPDIARQSAPPSAPQPPSRPPSRWGSMLGGALVGLGLGSLLSHSAERGATDASGTSGESGVNSADANAAQRADEEQGSGIGNVLLLGLLAVAVMWLVRRARRRKSRYESEKSQLRRF